MSHTPVETLVPEGTSADLTRVASQVLQGRKLNVVASIESARSLWDVDGIASRNEDDSLNVLVSVHNVRFSPIYNSRQKTICMRSNAWYKSPHLAIRLCGHWHNTKPFATGTFVCSLQDSHG